MIDPNTTIQELRASNVMDCRTANCLLTYLHSGYPRPPIPLSAVEGLSAYELLRIPNFGRKSLMRLNDVMRAAGLTPSEYYKTSPARPLSAGALARLVAALPTPELEDFLRRLKTLLAKE